MNETVHPRRRKKASAVASVESRLQKSQVDTGGKRSNGDAYASFLDRKGVISELTGIKNAEVKSEGLLPFARACCQWALRRGRAALFEGTGLTKTVQQCEWARRVEDYTGKPVLILAPLAVSHQTIAEAKNRLGMEIMFAENNTIIGERGVYITNYAKLDRFDASKFSGVAFDESSIVKSVDGKTKQKLFDSFGRTPFRLACTATPAPNDYMELGNHSELLGIMKASEMLSTFFVHDGGETQKWRLKGHAENDFWKWLSSWAICIQHPRDIGFEQEGYDLPPLRMHEHIVDTHAKPLPGELFALPARTLQERRGVRRDTIVERTEALRSIIETDPEDAWLAWCNLNGESEAIAKAAKMVNVTGSDEDEIKEKRILEFIKGEQKRLASKSVICGYGMNMQICHRVGFLGLSDSWEQLYQAIRRCWRFGQKHPVDVHIVISFLEGAVLQNIKRKEADAQRMQKALVEQMADFTKQEINGAERKRAPYKPTKKMEIPRWLTTEAA